MGRFFFIVAVLLITGCANRAEQGAISVTYTDADKPQSQRILDRSNRAIERIGKFWDVSFNQHVNIKVDPTLTRSRAFYAEKYITLSSIEVVELPTVIEHEIAHLVVDRSNTNYQFMNEGIAVYCEMMFKDDADASPEMLAERIDAPTRKAIKNTGYLPIDATNEAIDDRAGQYFSKRITAYYEAASFVKYLIGSYGLDKFKKVYGGQSFASVYAKSISQLEQEWLGTVFGDIGGVQLAASAQMQPLN